jgi:hypothetical protein
MAASGTLTTNMIALLYVTYDKNPFKWLQNMIKLGFMFFVICVFCGRIAGVAKFISDFFSNINQFAGHVGWYEKWLQFVNFIGFCLVKPETAITMKFNASYTLEHPVYALAQPQAVSVFGIIIGIIVMAGFFMNRKSKFAQLCFAWFLFAFFLLFIFGWDAPRNEMFLVAHYFGWAIFSLAFLFFQKLLEKFNAARNIVYTIALAGLLAVNIPGIYDLINFSVTYYPGW